MSPLQVVLFYLRQLNKDYNDLLEACENIKIYTDTMEEITIVMNQIAAIESDSFDKGLLLEIYKEL